MANKNNNKSIDVSYVFPETISKKSGDLYSNIPGIDELTIYEEPRWSFKDHLNNEVMNYLKENDNDLYEEDDDRDYVTLTPDSEEDVETDEDTEEDALVPDEMEEQE